LTIGGGKRIKRLKGKPRPKKKEHEQMVKGNTRLGTVKEGASDFT